MDDMTLSNNLDPMTIASYFIAVDEQRDDADITQMKLHKLLYFAQANYLASTGARLFDSDVEAFTHGPVIEKVRPRFNQYGRQIIVSADDAVAHNAIEDSQELPPDVVEFLDAIWSRFGQLSAAALRELTHRDAPWRDYYVEDVWHCLIPDHAMQQWYRSSETEDRQVYHPRVFRITEEDLYRADEPLSDEALARWGS